MPTRRKKPSNVVYAAARKLSRATQRPGAGLFLFDDGLVLTAKGMTRGRWRLPAFLRAVPISYHKADAWRNGYFQSYARAQEYVIQADERAKAWAVELILTHSLQPPLLSERYGPGIA